MFMRLNQGCGSRGIALFHPGQPPFHPITGNARKPYDFNSRMYSAGVLFSNVKSKRNVREQIGLSNHHQFSLKENRWILEWLIFALGHAQQDDLGGFPEIIARRTDQIPDVLNEQKLDSIKGQISLLQVDHASVQMTDSPGRDLPHRKTKSLQTIGIGFGLDVLG